MIRGRKHFSPSCNDGKWFPHPDCSESELKSRETSTTTGAMLKEVKSWSSKDYNFERYPLYKVHPKRSREFPFSHHDNKIAFKNDILVFQPDVGRKQYAYDLTQRKSHFSLGHDATENCTKELTGCLSTYKADFDQVKNINVPNRFRRFPHNHKLRSAEATVEQFMWFAQEQSNITFKNE